MIQNDTFSYLKANTVLFAQKICESLNDMCGAAFTLQKETIKEGTYSSPYNTVVFISFSGTIQGYYLLSLNETVALKLVGAYKENLSPQQIRDMREEFGELLKEVLNLAVGQIIEDLEKSFPAVTITPSTIVYGQIEFPNIMSGSISIEGREGMVLCGFSLNLANLKIGERLEETLKELEKQAHETEEAKRNIDSMLALLPIGLLTINAEGTILPGHSKSTPYLVGHPDDVEITGRFLPKFIAVDKGLFEPWKNWLSLTFDKFNELPFNDLKNLCPITECSNDFKHILTFKWFPVLSSDSGSLDKLLVVIEDVTHQRELEIKMEELKIRHQENLELISQVINLQPDEITEFIYDSSELLANAKKIIESNINEREFINELFRTFHTLKGSSGQFQFKALQELAQKVEKHLKLLRDNTVILSENTLAEIKRSIEDAKGYIERIQDVQIKLGGKAETIRNKALRDPHTVMASLNDIDATALMVKSIIEKCKKEKMPFDIDKDLEQIYTMISSLRTVHLSFFLSSFQSLVHNTSRKTGKKVLLSIGHDIRIDVAIIRRLHQCLIHIINNAIDHGIEAPKNRLEMGKTETGMIILSGTSVPNNIIISIFDDGIGINKQIISERIKTHYFYSDEDCKEMSEEEMFSFLFKPGFSTKDNTTEISGHGVGLDFVNHMIHQLDGSVSIASACGEGTTITLTIPVKN